MHLRVKKETDWNLCMREGIGKAWPAVRLPRAPVQPPQSMTPSTVKNIQIQKMRTASSACHLSYPISLWKLSSYNHMYCVETFLVEPKRQDRFGKALVSLIEGGKAKHTSCYPPSSCVPCEWAILETQAWSSFGESIHLVFGLPLFHLASVSYQHCYLLQRNLHSHDMPKVVTMFLPPEREFRLDLI